MATNMDGLKAKLRGGRKLTLPEVIDVMEVAGTQDLRAHTVLPLALRLIGRPKDPALRRAVWFRVPPAMAPVSRALQR